MKTTIEQRLAEAVCALVGGSVTFKRWVRNERTGCDSPVFGVPVSAVPLARSLGFDAWQFESSEVVR